MASESRNQALVKAIFRLWSRVYDQPFFQWTLFARVHRRLLEQARELRPSRVLDVGCGTGELLLGVAKRWPMAELSGIDLSSEMLDRARAKDFGRKVRLIEGSVDDLPFETGAFDLVFNSISSHFYVEGERAFSEMARVLVRGGTLLQASLTTGLLSHVPRLTDRSIVLPGAIYRAPAAQIRLLESAGLTVAESRLILPGVRLYRGVKD